MTAVQLAGAEALLRLKEAVAPMEEREFYLRSVHRRWQRALACSTGRVQICSPYLTADTALAVANAAGPARCEIYTRFSLEDFASGASSLKVLRSLVDSGFDVAEIPSLHAKVVVIEWEFASIGSQNLTASGIRNREATYCTTVPSEAKAVARMLSPWIGMGSPITRQMIDSADSVLPRLSREFRKVSLAAAAAEADLRAHEAKRLEEARRAEAAKSAASRRRRRVAKETANAIQGCYADDRVTKAAVRRIVEWCTWWHSHSSGRPVRAYGYANRIVDVNGDLRIAFGANTFLVGRALDRCLRTLNECSTKWSSDEALDALDVVHRLRYHVCGAVAAYHGSEISGFYPVSGNDMMFGTISIDIKEFIENVLEMLPPEFVAPLIEVNKQLVGP